MPRTASISFPLLTALVVAASPVAGQGAGDTTATAGRPFFTRADAITLGAFAVATAAAAPADRYFAERLQNPWAQENRVLKRGTSLVQDIAAPGTFVIAGALYAAGRLTDNHRMASLGLHATEAIVLGAGVVGVTKAITGRARPYATADTNPYDFRLGRGVRKEDYRSFPSGHSVMAFAAAAAVTGETARWWPKATPYIGTALYGGAALAGVSRMYNNKHWASDVLVGAAIGTFVGQKVVRYHRTHPENRVDRWFLQGSLVPVPGGGRVLKLALIPGL